MRFSFIMAAAEGEVFTQATADHLVGQRPTVSGIVVGETEYPCYGQVMSAQLTSNGDLWVTAEINQEEP